MFQESGCVKVVDIHNATVDVSLLVSLLQRVSHPSGFTKVTLHPKFLLRGVSDATMNTARVTVEDFTIEGKVDLEALCLLTQFIQLTGALYLSGCEILENTSENMMTLENIKILVNNRYIYTICNLYIILKMYSILCRLFLK